MLVPDQAGAQQRAPLLPDDPIDSQQSGWLSGVPSFNLLCPPVAKNLLPNPAQGYALSSPVLS